MSTHLSDKGYVKYLLNLQLKLEFQSYTQYYSPHKWIGGARSAL